MARFLEKVAGLAMHLLARPATFSSSPSCLARRCMARFLETLQGEDYVAMWRGSVLLAAACLLVTSKLVSVSPLPAKLLLHYSGQAFSMEELTSCELLLLSKLGWDVYLDR